MSFDLGAFGKQNDINNLSQIYVKACDSDISGIQASPEMVNFVKRLNELYPDLNSVVDDEIDLCPWASGFDQSDRHWIAPMSFSFVQDMVPKIVNLARECDVYIYDPQSDRVIS